MNFLKKFFNSITKTKAAIDRQFLEELESTFMEADMGVKACQMILARLEELNRNLKLTGSTELKSVLKDYLNELIMEGELLDSPGLKIILFTGINGVGKTTSLAKLTNYLLQKPLKIKIAAGDTFRAAAIDQLNLWANRLKVPIIKASYGSDSGAVVFDAITSSLKDHTDYLVIDTAGRMHTSEDLMRELQKIKKICLKRVQENNIENILVVDCTTGQNSFIQAETFNKYIPVTGIFLSKYDSIFKGGIVIRISAELKIPIKFIGTGESLSDFSLFNKNKFIESLGL